LLPRNGKDFLEMSVRNGKGGMTGIRLTALPIFFVQSVNFCCQGKVQEPVGLRVKLRQIRLDGPNFAVFLVNRTTIALQNRQNLSSPSRIFASIF